MLDRTLIAILATIALIPTGLMNLFLGGDDKPGGSTNTTTTIETATTIEQPTTTTTAPPIDKAQLELYFQLRNPEVPPIAYWEDVARCETGTDWQNGGRFAGGLGIMTSGKFRDDDMGTWERWGGEEFAPSPDKATKVEQIVVANRIAVTGWKTVVKRDPVIAKRQGVPATYVWSRQGRGYDGWGCIVNTVGTPRQWAKGRG